MTFEVNGNKPLPKEVKQLATQRFSELSQKASEDVASLSTEQQAQLEAVLGLSDFVYSHLCRNPQWITAIAEEVAEEDRCLFYRVILQKKLTEVTDLEQAKKNPARFS